MKILRLLCYGSFAVMIAGSSMTGRAQPSPPDCTNCLELNEWYFPPTNFLSHAGYAPVNFTNLLNIGGTNGNRVLIDTTNITPAFLFYDLVQTNLDSTTFTNLTSAGTIYVWFNPQWSSTNQGGTGPGNWANLISLGGTNGAWWAWYLSPDGCTMYLASQTNGGSPSNYLSAPVSFLGTNWYNLTLVYGPTNTAFYTNGVLVTNGTSAEYWPGTNVNIFTIGSDSNGYFQACGEFSDLETFNFQFDSANAWEYFSIVSIIYGLGGTNTNYSSSSDLGGAPFTNMIAPTFDAVTGPGFLVANGSFSSGPTNANVWITNYSATVISTNVLSLNFAVGGGSNSAAYDVFATGALTSSITNAVWYWMGQAYRGTNYALPITNSLVGNVFLILGTPQDSDGDGLTDAYELLVSHTNPYNSDTSGDGMLDGWKVVWGLNPNLNNAAQPSERANYGYDPASRLDQVTGIRVETITIDGEENVLSAH